MEAIEKNKKIVESGTSTYACCHSLKELALKSWCCCVKDHR